MKRPCLHAAHFLQPELVAVEVERLVDIGDAHHGVQVFHRLSSPYAGPPRRKLTPLARGLSCGKHIMPRDCLSAENMQIAWPSLPGGHSMRGASQRRRKVKILSTPEFLRRCVGDSVALAKTSRAGSLGHTRFACRSGGCACSCGDWRSRAAAIGEKAELRGRNPVASLSGDAMCATSVFQPICVWGVDSAALEVSPGEMRMGQKNRHI